MSDKSKSMTNISSALGLVFGAAAGLLISILCSFSIALGIVFGAAIGLIIGIMFFSYSKSKMTK